MDVSPSVTITAHTKFCAVIGHPVEHSFSPPMQNAAIQALGLPWAFLAFNVKPENLGSAIVGAAALGIIGMNVTIPHKETVVTHLDELDELAEAIGAVNTIHFTEGKAKGYNTDGYGFTQSVLSDGELEMAGATVLILGAGGAARGMAAGAAAEGARKVILANRTRSKAEKIADELGRAFPTVQWEVVQASAPSLANAAGRSQIIGNATSLGMKPGDALPIPAEALQPGQVVFDSVYVSTDPGAPPGETALLKAAKAAGCIPVTGLGMLARQGALSLSIWSGMEPDEDLMLSMLIKHVRGRGQ
jgi:shikimate dehydrogenase